MQGMATALITLGGLLLSLSCAVLLEELFLGGLFRLFFAPRLGSGNATDRRLGDWRNGISKQKRGSERVR